MQRGRQNNNFKGTVDITVCTAAVRSDFFWSYLKMVAVLTELGNEVHIYFQACPCHQSKEVMKRLKASLPVGCPSCPLAGRVLPQLAVGDLERFCHRLFNARQLEVVRMTHGLCALELGRVLQDYEAGRQHMLTHLRLKGAYHLGCRSCSPASFTQLKILRAAQHGVPWINGGPCHQSCRQVPML